MVHMVVALLLAVTGSSSKLSYEDAFAKAQQEDKPLLILVGARWCASCQVMKRDTIEPMKESGELKDVVVTYLDKDERPELAEQLMKGQTLPQIVMFSKESGKWKKFSLTGMQSRTRMAELVGKAGSIPTRTLR